MEMVEFYKEYVPEVDKVKMNDLEEEVRLLKEFHDEEEVEAQIGSLIPDMGFSRTRNSKFYRTLELYWKTKTLVAMGMLPKEKNFI